jgi:hypothetical protein
MPSPEIDAAILAAAHRAVQSAPRAAGKAAEATSPWRWWMPLAAAATIGAITIGVFQLMPKESEPTTATVLSDAPSSALAVPAPNIPPPPAGSTNKDKAEAPRAQTEVPRAKVRADRATPAQAPKSDNERAAAPEPFPARQRDAMEQGTPAGAVARHEGSQAPALSKQMAAADAQVASPEQWIARIRALLTERKTDEAAHELIAFRAAYSDADARLPAEMQAWAATVKPELTGSPSPTFGK